MNTVTVNRTPAFERLRQTGIVPVVRAASVDVAVALSRALVEGGIDVLEITLTVPGATEVLQELRRVLSPGVLLGAGTVTRLTEVQACLESGVEFIVTPVCVPELVAPCHDAGVLTAIGAATPTEVWQAWSSGTDFVKVFPISALGGPSFIASLREPFPDVKVMPSGGVELSNVEQYLAAGAAVLGVGPALADTNLLREQGHAAVVQLARSYRAKVDAYRAQVLPPQAG